MDRRTKEQVVRRVLEQALDMALPIINDPSQIPANYVLTRVETSSGLACDEETIRLDLPDGRWLFLIAGRKAVV